MSLIFNILLISHGSIAQSYVDTLSMITGECPTGIIACSINGGDLRSSLEKKIIDAMKQLANPDGVLVFADLFGGTPCNAAITEFLGKYERIQLLAGFNLAMLFEAVSNRCISIEQAAEEIEHAGRAGIVNVNKRILTDSRQEDNE